MRHVLAYLVFVGLPLAGLLAVLRLGQGVAAPMAIHGSYAVTTMAGAGSQCYAYLLGGADSTISVAQSGRQVTVALGPAGNVRLTGAVSGTALALAGVLAPGVTPDSVGCSSGDTLHVVARAHREERIKRLDATLFATPCTDCAPVYFTASRPRVYAGRRRS